MELVVRVIEAGELAEVVRDPMRLAGARCSGHQARKLEEPLDERLLLGERERAEVNLVPGRQDDLLLGGRAEQARHTGVYVLDVEDGVVGGLPRRHCEIEVERAVVASGEEGEARRIPPDLLQELL